ncbi:MAG: hypothetical protein A3F12_04595 [Gammaproteobacteria bacterium RIFCSPHIGHO2_12_FULL_38_14]|nr:MAG: hypothetical protein A3F12_04595 [Gammaproteobacteria bacterium RIFCSPHIGHO2_12_FULL_38_14]
MFDESQYTLEIKENASAPIVQCSSYMDFLSGIRVRLDNSLGYFEVKLTFSDMAGPWIMIRRSDLYIIGIAGQKLQNLEYENSDLNLGRDSLLNAIRMANKAVQQHTEANLDPNTCKVLSFFISEAARFEMVEHSCYVMFNNSACNSSWLEWAPLLKSWQKLSPLASAHVSIPSGGFVVPIGIETSQAASYDIAFFSKATNHATLALAHLHQNFEKEYLKLRDSDYNPTP